MSGTNESNSNCPPSNPNKSVDKDGYRASFYPGFVSRLAVKDPATGSETELYQQTEIFCLPPGSRKPWPTSTLQFARPDGRRIVLQIDDPDQQIGRIEIHLKSAGTTVRKDLVQQVVGEVQALAADGGAALMGEEPPPEEPADPELILICEDGPVLCPPWCPG